MSWRLYVNALSNLRNSLYCFSKAFEGDETLIAEKQKDKLESGGIGTGYGKHASHSALKTEQQIKKEEKGLQKGTDLLMRKLAEGQLSVQPGRLLRARLAS